MLTGSNPNPYPVLRSRAELCGAIYKKKYLAHAFHSRLHLVFVASASIGRSQPISAAECNSLPRVVKKHGSCTKMAFPRRLLRLHPNNDRRLCPFYGLAPLAPTTFKPATYPAMCQVPNPQSIQLPLLSPPLPPPRPPPVPLRPQRFPAAAYRVLPVWLVSPPRTQSVP